MSDRQYDVVPQEVLLSYSGLDFLQAIIDGRLPAPPIMQTLGFALVTAEKGRVVFEGVPEHRHYNPIGLVHGGFAMTLLDSALGCAVHTALDKGDAYTTLEVKVNFVRPLSKYTGLIRAEGRLLHRGRTVGTADGEIKDASGKLYAHATTTCMIFPAKG
jgi:uncharacterized protein (TIGR00369 family)